MNFMYLNHKYRPRLNIWLEIIIVNLNSNEHQDLD